MSTTALVRMLAGATTATPVRHAMFEGRDHIVVPVIAMVEGLVHAENAPASELVRASELAVAIAGWNGRPVVLGHPSDDTGPVSAGTPERLEAQAFGRVFNAHMQGDKLAMDAWLDPAQAAQVGPEAVEAMARIGRGELVDVSVGVFMVPEVAARGLTEWTRIVPDHLAILPKGVPGACSIEMGCGVPRAAAATDTVPVLLKPGERVLNPRDVARAVERALENPGGTNQYGGPYGGGGGAKPGDSAGHASTGAGLAQSASSGRGETQPDGSAWKESTSSATSARDAMAMSAGAVRQLEQAGFSTTNTTGHPDVRQEVSMSNTDGRDAVVTVLGPGKSSSGQYDVTVGIATPHHSIRTSAASPQESTMLDKVRNAVAAIIGRPWALRLADDLYSDQDIREQLSALLRADVPGFLGVEVVYPQTHQVVYAAAPEDHVIMQRRSFTSDPDLALEADVEDVEQKTTYEPVERQAASDDPPKKKHDAACQCANDHGRDTHPCTCGGSPAPTVATARAAASGEKAMKERTKKLIKASKGKLTDADAEWLDGIPAGKLKFIAAAGADAADDAAANAAAADDDDDDDDEETPEEKAAKAKAAKAAKAAKDAAAQADPPPADTATRTAAAAATPAPLTNEEWLNAAPPEIRALVDRAKADEATRKTTLLAALKGKVDEAYSETELQAMSVDQLTRVAKLALPKEPAGTAIDYSGLSVARAADPAVIPPAPDLHARVRAAAAARKGAAA